MNKKCAACGVEETLGRNRDTDPWLCLNATHCRLRCVGSGKEALDKMRGKWLWHFGYSQGKENYELKDSDRDFFEAWDSYAERILK